MSYRIQYRRATAAVATANNVVLAAGEPGLETDTGKVKVGDGITDWNSLAYEPSTGSVAAAQAAAVVTAGTNADTKIADERVTERANQMNTYVMLPGPATDTQINALINTTLNNAVKYTLNTYLPTAYPGTAQIGTFGGNVEANIRPPASAALGLAVALHTGVYDPTLTGVSEVDATAQAVRLATSVAALHVSNGGAWGGPKNTGPSSTGNGWQENLWAADAGVAAFLLWGSLTVGQQTLMTNMAIWEADRMLAWRFLYWRDTAGVENSVGDSKSEEIAWDSMSLLLALAMQPAHAHADRWWQKLAFAGLAQSAHPSDLTNSTAILGYVPSTELRGTNIADTGELVNHDGIAPDYIASAGDTLWGLLPLASEQGIALPSTATRGAALQYGALTKVEYVAGVLPATYPEGGAAAAPGGTMYKWPDTDGSIYFPQGTSWGTKRRVGYALFDVLAYRYGWDRGLNPGAGYWAQVHLTSQLANQSRFTTGQTYTTDDFTEDTYGSPSNYAREMWVLQGLAFAAYAMSVARPTFTGTPRLANTWAATVAGLTPTQWLRLTDGPTTFADSSGNSHTGTAVGTINMSPLGSVVPSNVSGAAIFISGGQAVRSTYASWMDGAYSIAVAINRVLGADSTDKFIVSRYNDAADGTTGSCAIRVNVTTNFATASVFSSAGALSTITSSVNVFDGEPHLLVLTVVNGAQVFYIDGVSVGTPLAIATPQLAGNQSLCWGGRLVAGAISQGFNGRLGDCAYFTGALTPTQVTALNTAFKGQ